MQNNNLMWIVIGGVAIYFLYQQQQQTQATETAANINSAGNALGGLFTALSTDV